jgi:hypothetical protein
MALKKELKLLNTEIEYFENYVSSSWLGKWFCKVKLEEILIELDRRKKLKENKK